MRKMMVMTFMLLLAAGMARASSEVEPNNRPDNATPILAGDRILANINTRNDRDCYSFTLSAGGITTLVAGQQASGTGLTFSLANAAGSVVQVVEAVNLEGKLGDKLLPAGDYVLTVSSRTGTPGGYWFRYDLAAPGADSIVLPGWWRQLPSAAGRVSDSLPPTYDLALLTADSGICGQDDAWSGPTGILAYDYPAGLPAFVDLTDTGGRVFARWKMEEDSRAGNRVWLQQTGMVVSPELRGELLPGMYLLRCYAGDYRMHNTQGRELRVRLNGDSVPAGAARPSGAVAELATVAADGGVWWILDKVAWVVDNALPLPAPEQ